MMSGSSVPFPTRPFVGPGRVLYGVGSAESLGTELTAIGGRPAAGVVMVVADAALLALGLVAPIVASLEAEGFTVRVGRGVTAEPGPDTITGLVDIVGDDAVGAVVGIGGGSALDAAKLVAAATTNELELTVGLPATAWLDEGPLLLAIPTTAGTGAEATAVAMLWHEQRKRIFVNERLVPRHATLDPALTRALPPSVVAASGLDAISHAIESLLSTFRTPMTVAAAERAVARLAGALPKAYTDPDDDARGAMLLGAHEAGLALNASVVSGHSIAYALSSHAGLPHGVTCAMALPYCLAFSREAAEEEIAAIGPLVGVKADASATLRWLTALTAQLNLPSSLEAVGISSGDLPALAAEIAESYPRANSPVPLTKESLERLLRHFHPGDIEGAWAAAASYATA
jgi:alcohol dehydrogenase class IV